MMIIIIIIIIIIFGISLQKVRYEFLRKKAAKTTITN